MLEQPLIIEDALSPFIFSKLAEIVTSSKMDWRVESTNSYDCRPSFNNVIDLNGETKKSKFFKICADMCGSAAGLPSGSLSRIRFALIQRPSEFRIHAPHVDNVKPHIVGLLYLNESDGDTVLWRDKSGLEEVMRISPKPNRLVVFDGAIMHSSSTPQANELRYVMNMNFTQI
jgi:hypothetical protein